MGAETRPPPSETRGLHAAAVPTVVIAAAAAAIGYAAHHAPALSPHTATTLLAVLVAAAVLGLAAIGFEAGRRHPPLPAVVLAAPGTTSLRAARSDDDRFCAALHAEALAHGFFVALGPRFLRAYYATFIESPHAVALVATAGDQPLGFVVGITAPRAHARWTLRKHGARLAVAGAAALATRPLIGLRFGRTRFVRYVGAWRRHRRDRGPAPPRPAAGPAAVLSHVAVAPGAQGAGLGAQLVRAFTEAAAARGAERVVLLTLAGERGAGPFYEAHGWEEGPNRTTPDGDVMREWVFRLPGAAPR